jgi:hypothetical protein
VTGDGGRAARDSAHAEDGLRGVDEGEHIFGGLKAGLENLRPKIGGDVDYGGIGIAGVGEEGEGIRYFVVFLESINRCAN